jgi:para-aminobenzoate synthetase component 2
MKTLLIDNNDSFTHNLEHLLVAATGFSPEIVPYDRLADTPLEKYDVVVISPGPLTPADYPAYDRLLAGKTPILGICLGMQIINDYYGGETTQLPGCVHGRTDVVVFEDRRVTVARYHSLHVKTVGVDLEVFARNADGVPMALRHMTRPIVGYQFHPESFLTSDGQFFVNHALNILGLAEAGSVSKPRTATR